MSIYAEKLQQLIDDAAVTSDELSEIEAKVEYDPDDESIGFFLENSTGSLSVSFYENDKTWNVFQDSEDVDLEKYDVDGQGFNNLIDWLTDTDNTTWFGNIMDPQNYYVEEEEEITENCDDKLNEGLGTRDYSDMLFDMIEAGTVDPVQIAEDLIYWCTEEDIEKYMKVNNLIFEEDEEETDDFI